MLILESQDFSEEVIRGLRKWATVDLGMPAGQNLLQVLARYDVCWFRLAHRIDERVLTEQSRCRVLVTPVTGIDHIDEQLCVRLGVKIICLRGEVEFLKEIRATAEMTLGLALALMRHIPQASTSVLAGEWDRDRFRGHELYRKTAGIIGLGRLGEITAGYFHTMGMNVIAYDPHRTSMPPHIVAVGSLEALAAKADLISLHVNYRPETHGLIGNHFFQYVKPSAFLINTSRGGIIDEHALLVALKEKRLAGAALDVLIGEPDIEANPLVAYARRHDNLLIVPHIGGNTYESFAKTESFMAKRLQEYWNSIEA